MRAVFRRWLPRLAALRAEPLSTRPLANCVYRPDGQPQAAQDKGSEHMDKVIAFVHVTNKHRRLATYCAMPAPVLLRHRESLARIVASLRATHPLCQAMGVA